MKSRGGLVFGLIDSITADTFLGLGLLTGAGRKIDSALIGLVGDLTDLRGLVLLLLFR